MDTAESGVPKSEKTASPLGTSGFTVKQIEGVSASETAAHGFEDDFRGRRRRPQLCHLHKGGRSVDLDFRVFNTSALVTAR